MGFIGFQHNPRDTALSLSLSPFPSFFSSTLVHQAPVCKEDHTLHFSFKKACLSLFTVLWNSTFSWVYLSLSSRPFTSFFLLIYITLPETSFPRFFPNSFSLTSTLPLRFSQVIPCQGKFSESPLCTHRKSCVHQFCLYIHSFSSHDAYFFVLNGFLKKTISLLFTRFITPWGQKSLEY